METLLIVNSMKMKSPYHLIIKRETIITHFKFYAFTFKQQSFEVHVSVNILINDCTQSRVP